MICTATDPDWYTSSRNDVANQPSSPVVGVKVAISSFLSMYPTEFVLNPVPIGTIYRLFFLLFRPYSIVASRWSEGSNLVLSKYVSDRLVYADPTALLMRIY